MGSRFKILLFTKYAFVILLRQHQGPVSGASVKMSQNPGLGHSLGFGTDLGIPPSLNQSTDSYFLSLAAT